MTLPQAWQIKSTILDAASTRAILALHRIGEIANALMILMILMIDSPHELRGLP